MKKINYARDLLEGPWDDATDGGSSYPVRRRHDDPEEEAEEEDVSVRGRSNTMASISATLGASNMQQASGQQGSIRQADSLPMGYRVETANRFMSLSSRPVTVPAVARGDTRDGGGGGSVSNSGSGTPRKRSSITGQDRQAFHRILGALYKSQKKQESAQVETEEHELYERQMSKEAIRYQNDWKDLIWLELRAWFAGTEACHHDEWLIKEREALDIVANLANTFRFEPNDPHWERKLMFQFSSESSNSNSLIFYDAQESLEARLSLTDAVVDPIVDAALSTSLSRFQISEVSTVTSPLKEEDRQDTLTDE